MRRNPALLAFIDYIEEFEEEFFNRKTEEYGDLRSATEIGHEGIDIPEEQLRPSEKRNRPKNQNES